MCAYEDNEQPYACNVDNNMPAVNNSFIKNYRCVKEEFCIYLDDNKHFGRATPKLISNLYERTLIASAQVKNLSKIYITVEA